MQKKNAGHAVPVHSGPLGGCFQKKYGNDFIVSPDSIVLGLVGWELI